MKIRNRNKLFSVSLVGAALATGLVSQGALANIDPAHDLTEPSGQATSAEVERQGPRGEVLLVGDAERATTRVTVAGEGPQGDTIVR